MASASSSAVAEAPPSTNADDGKHSTIAHAGLGTRLTHLSRPSGHCFVNPPVQRGSTVLFPTVKERNASWFDRKRFEQELTYGINGSEVSLPETGCVGCVGLINSMQHMSHWSSFPPLSLPAPSLPPHTQTHHMLEDMIANIEGGTRAQITSSGLSACTVALLAYQKQEITSCSLILFMAPSVGLLKGCFVVLMLTSSIITPVRVGQMSLRC